MKIPNEYCGLNPFKWIDYFMWILFGRTLTCTICNKTYSLTKVLKSTNGTDKYILCPHCGLKIGEFN